MHAELIAARDFAYEPSGLRIDNFVNGTEGKEYGASGFEIHHRRIQFRVGKITPVKIGCFVTLWKRVGAGPILPFDLEDPVDLFVVSVRNASRFGQFVFPKSVLCEQGIVSTKARIGKLAMRIYPPWDTPENRQANHTQAWQLLYFFEIPLHASVDIARVQTLFYCK